MYLKAKLVYCLRRLEKSRATGVPLVAIPAAAAAAPALDSFLAFEKPVFTVDDSDPVVIEVERLMGARFESSLCVCILLSVPRRRYARCLGR
jgi:hypothetical protein